MQELYDDNVMYAELRTSLSGYYELDGYVLDPLATVGIYKETIAKYVLIDEWFLILCEKQVTICCQTTVNRLSKRTLIIFRLYFWQNIIEIGK